MSTDAKLNELAELVNEYHHQRKIVESILERKARYYEYFERARQKYDQSEKRRYQALLQKEEEKQDQWEYKMWGSEVRTDRLIDELNRIELSDFQKQRFNNLVDNYKNRG